MMARGSSTSPGWPSSRCNDARPRCRAPPPLVAHHGPRSVLIRESSIANGWPGQCYCASQMLEQRWILGGMGLAAAALACEGSVEAERGAEANGGSGGDVATAQGG